MRPEAREQWSERNQTLRHSGTKVAGDDEALTEDPKDYSAVGGPEDEQRFGAVRNDTGNFPFNSLGGPYDRDSRAEQMTRGGYLKDEPESGLDRVHHHDAEKQDSKKE
jgi:hypothetical protein